MTAKTYVKVGLEFVSPEFDSTNGIDFEGNADLIFDWVELPNAVIEGVARRLADFGLEVTSHETNGDFHAFSISKIKRTRKTKK
jgi:sugar phosphate isomerase/epimerase